ncbi:MAG TPA: type II toxin-antitoxin system VapC family toxin [Pyrinomonadaceae bacterium]|nr:type II toxin-antitoxin system VapC family toxin [Pyrinomonadaceae bacterium]
MRLLLDTHVFLWYISADKKLSEAVRDAVRDPANEVYLSVVSLWEAMIKHQLGKLPLPRPPGDYLPAQRTRHGISSLALDEASVTQLARLPAIHRDPFDRMLISQALEHGLTLVTVDDVFRSYSVTVF